MRTLFASSKKKQPVARDSIQDPVLRDLHGRGHVAMTVESAAGAKKEPAPRTKTRRPSVAQLMEQNPGRVRALSREGPAAFPPPAEEAPPATPEAPSPKRREKVRRKSLEEIQALRRASCENNHFVRQDSIRKQQCPRPEVRQEQEDAVEFEVDDAAPNREDEAPKASEATLQPSPRSVIPPPAAAPAEPQVADARAKDVPERQDFALAHVAFAGLALALALAFASSALQEILGL